MSRTHRTGSRRRRLAPLTAAPTATRPTWAGLRRRSPSFADLQNEQRSYQQPDYEDAEDDRVATGQVENVRPGVEVVEHEASQEAGDHAGTRRGDVREPEEQARLIARDHVGDEGPVDREERPQARTDQYAGGQCLCRELGDPQRLRHRRQYGGGQPAIAGEQQYQRTGGGDQPTDDDQRLAPDAVGEACRR